MASIREPRTTITRGLIYAAFQERATRISTIMSPGLPPDKGEENLARICRRIAGDEARHETFYAQEEVVAKIMDEDPEEAMLAYRMVLKGDRRHPGKLMTDGKDANLYDHFAAVATRLGVYTATDYTQIIGHLSTKRGGSGSTRPTGKAAKAQGHLCRAAWALANRTDADRRGLPEQPPAHTSPGSMDDRFEISIPRLTPRPSRHSSPSSGPGTCRGGDNDPARPGRGKEIENWSSGGTTSV